MERRGPFSFSWIVHKFGGTSVATGTRIKNVSSIVSSESKRLKSTDGDDATAVVVSAMGGITNKFLECISLAESKSPIWASKLEAIVEAHIIAVGELGLKSEQAAAVLIASLKSDAKDVRDILHAIALTQSCSKAARDMIVSYGELWSSRLLFETFKELYGPEECGYADAREFITVQETDVGPAVMWPETHQLLSKFMSKFEKPVKWIVAPGFVCRSPSGVATTLSRNGSDFSATIFGALLCATEVHIWTDVDGIFSADPRKVPKAVLLDQMTYTEALELSYFGAKVLHHQSIQPVMSNGIPLWIRNTFNPECLGTKITTSSALSSSPASSVKGFSLIDQISLLNVEGTGMQGVSGIAERIFGALKNAGVSVTLITQASSEHSVTAAIPSNQGTIAKRAVEDAFFREISNNLIQTVDIVNDCSILAAVGDGMIHTRGVAAKLFTSLAAAQVNVLAIAQGSSERNISVVINAKDSDVALRTVHDHFYNNAAKSNFVNIAIIGYGGVGSALVRQLKAVSKRLSSQLSLDIRVRIIARSGKMLVEPNLLDVDLDVAWMAPIPNSNHSVAKLLLADHPAAAIVIDTSASEAVTDFYLGWMEQGIHVVAANKKFFSGDLKRFEQMKSLVSASTSKLSCSFEATVCAGLPVISTIMDMVESGDEIETITGVFSGTLSFLFNTLRTSHCSFSQIVKTAKELVYTEPDPRDDLSGLDFARKVVILARLAGVDADLSNVDLRGLVPHHLMECSVSEFMSQLESRTLITNPTCDILNTANLCFSFPVDADIASRKEKAAQDNSTLAYIGLVDVASKKVSVSLEPIPLSSPLASLTGANNIISIKTKRYQSPLVIQGPGAGAEVTAAGVFSDLLQVLKRL
eukprot:TRINITY_DN13496_c0_g1_i1.p1 TRINITY_DN13496_c0_g1~~TRINITY_DN13496_c0_g1_i1.p1  ORF type:complete len:869 (-),score=176.61 TRINITY_DN13496_c0_g1_i1:49-2655(-)